MAKGDTQGSGYFPGIYQSAVAQNARDYDSIMQQYKNLTSKESNNFGQKVNYTPITPQYQSFTPGPSYDYVKDFAQTGGYSDSDISNLRERAISPIRSIYDSANRNLLRQKNLSGGYAPNLPAAQAKMARESSDLISGKTTDVNAAIAEMQQRGRLAGANLLAPLESAEAARNQSVNAANTNIANQFALANAENEMKSFSMNKAVDDNSFEKILEGIKGQHSLYGTNPALASTFGNQALVAGNLVNSFPPISRNQNPGLPLGTGGNNNSQRLGIPRGIA